MLRLIGIVLSIGLADSLNPSTLGPALYLAAGPRPRHTVAQFTAGVFLVYLVGGAVFAVGPGEIVLALVPKPDQTTRQVLEVVAGAVLITVGALLWSYRARLGRKAAARHERRAAARGWLLGAMITAVELPTAFPYFAALAAIMGSGLGIVRQAILVVLFNVCFVLPLLAIIAILPIRRRPRRRGAGPRPRLPAAPLARDPGRGRAGRGRDHDRARRDRDRPGRRGRLPALASGGREAEERRVGELEAAADRVDRLGDRREQTLPAAAGRRMWSEWVPVSATYSAAS